MDVSPRLSAVAGPLRGSSFSVPESGISIGRDAANAIAIADAALSRRHCELSLSEEGWRLTDLASRNGTFVNGIPVNRRTLTPGDRIQAGDSLFVFDGPGEVSPAAGVRLSDDSGGEPTLQIPPEGMLYLQPERRSSRETPALRLSRDLAALIRLASELPASRGIDALAIRLFTRLAEVVPAERGALLVKEGDDLRPIVAWDAHDVSPGFAVSRTIAKRVAAEGVAILFNGREQAGGIKSLLELGASALMAVPLRLADRVTGVLYLDTTDPATSFDEPHLQLVTAAGAVAAASLESARENERLADENRRLQDELALEHDLVGESPALKEVLRVIARAAPTEATVLIRGESGTGKELAARALHVNSARAKKPFVAINCAALTESLLESELFGHEPGAFTGAAGLKKGKLEVAEGGTVFLDEVGELGPALQAKLLRVLQERTFERVGGTRTLPLDIRLVAATNRDLEAAIRQGTFRQDLYYRLDVLTLTMPPLRDRKDDIPLLSAYFASRLAKRLKRRVRGVSERAKSLLAAYEWPGNVRELENALERAAVLGAGEWIEAEDLPETVTERSASRGAGPSRYHDELQETKRRLIRDALAKTSGNVTEAARLLGLHPNYVHRLMTGLDLRAL